MRYCALPDTNSRSAAPFTPYSVPMVHPKMRAAYPSTVRLAVMRTLSSPATGLLPGAVVKVTMPAVRSTV